MGGGGKKQTVGYWYKWAMHFGFCTGPIDALLDLQAGGVSMWSGRMTASGRLHIDKQNLWGGESKEGGVRGDWDVMFGEPTQVANDYLIAVMGSTPPAEPGGNLSFKDLLNRLFARVQPPVGAPSNVLRGHSAHRGKFTVVARGGWFGANIPNPKSVSAKVERILTDWEGGAPWYPEKAAIPVIGAAVAYDADDWKYRVEPPGSSADYSAANYDDSGWAVGKGGFGSGDPGGGLGVGTYIPAGAVGQGIWLRRVVNVTAGAGLQLDIYHDDGAWVWVNGAPVTLTNVAYYHATATVPPGQVQQRNVIVLKVLDSVPSGTPTNIYASMSITPTGGGLNAMNPAHILYDSIVHSTLQHEPAGLINDASFRAAADRFYTEGLGLCTVYDSSAETPEQFQQRICNLAACNLNKSRVDGLYYLDLVRAVDDPSSLPVITESDVKSFKQTPVVVAEAPNLMRVEWFDPQLKQERTTAPVYAAGAIQSAGAVIPDDRKYHEVPIESLALRLAKRELDTGCTPVSKYDLGLLPRFRGLRPGMSVRLQLPSEGIADQVITVASLDQGTLRNGQMQLTAVQNVFAMPDAVYVEPDVPIWQPPDTSPAASLYQVALEAPYIELAATLSTADLQVLAPDAGYLIAAAVRPPAGINYQLWTAVAAGDYESVATADWCPTAKINEAAAELDTAFTFSFGLDLEAVAIGSWALWDSEIVRVDVLDIDAGTIHLGRGCADTAPSPHAAESRIMFCGDWLSADSREYALGDVVHAKLLTRTTTIMQDLAEAAAIDITMDERAARPYPPGALAINGQPYPANLSGLLAATWAHRDRLVQSDQLIDTTQPSVGPEPGTTYTVRYYQPPGTLVATEAGLTGTSATPYAFDANGQASIAVNAVRDGVESLQANTATFDYVLEPRATTAGDLRTTTDGATRATTTG